MSKKGILGIGKLLLIGLFLSIPIFLIAYLRKEAIGKIIYDTHVNFLSGILSPSESSRRRLQRFDPALSGEEGPVTRHRRRGAKLRNSEMGIDVGRPRQQAFGGGGGGAINGGGFGPNGGGFNPNINQDSGSTTE